MSPSEGSLAPESSSKECDIATTILNDDHPQLESMEQQPSSSTCQGGVLDQKMNAASLLEMQLIKTEDMFEMDPSIVPPSNEVGLLDGTKDVAKEVFGISEKLPIQTRESPLFFLTTYPKE